MLKKKKREEKRGWVDGGEGDFRENHPMQLRSAACFFFFTCFRLIAAELLRLAAADRE